VIPSQSYFGGALPMAFTEQGVAMLSGNSMGKLKRYFTRNVNLIY